MDSFLDNLRQGKRKIESSLLHRWPRIPIPLEDENTGMVFVDGDNLRGYAKDTRTEYILDPIIDWLKPENTGIDQIEAVHVFFTKVVGYHVRWDIKLADPSRFTVHTYLKKMEEAGYPDEELYRLAWAEAHKYHTGVFISNDKGFAEAAEHLRNGFNAYSASPELLNNPPEILLVSSYYGKTQKWIEASGAIDLDQILFEIGARGPVNRPTQP